LLEKFLLEYIAENKTHKYKKLYFSNITFLNCLYFNWFYQYIYNTNCITTFND